MAVLAGGGIEVLAGGGILVLTGLGSEDAVAEAASGAAALPGPAAGAVSGAALASVAAGAGAAAACSTTASAGFPAAASASFGSSSRVLLLGVVCVAVSDADGCGAGLLETLAAEAGVCPAFFSAGAASFFFADAAEACDTGGSPSALRKATASIFVASSRRSATAARRREYLARRSSISDRSLPIMNASKLSSLLAPSFASASLAIPILASTWARSASRSFTLAVSVSLVSTPSTRGKSPNSLSMPPGPLADPPAGPAALRRFGAFVRSKKSSSSSAMTFVS
mmetsp:Transcript_50828/g.95318  ORF Transcript_50828/g.95318 Transcript_50828/m.95318 type:complete len:283 (-) Transcript_50828:1136-1984(-)